MIYITRKAIENEEYEADDGVLILLAPKGMPTTRYFRKLCAEQNIRDLYPKQQKREPEDGRENNYEVGSIFLSTNTDED